MAKIKITCPGCGRIFPCGEQNQGNKIKCAHCKQVILVPRHLVPRQTRDGGVKRRHRKCIWLIAGGVLALIALLVMWLIPPMTLHWPDRRPIGTLFLASHSASSATNPRGWFNNPQLDVTGTNGPENFRKALWKYTDQSLTNLKRVGAQGVIVWDLEGEQYPHKISFIGDPRLVGRLAPEMAPVVNELFERLRGAELKVGMTIRPQQLVFEQGQPRQKLVLNLRRTLLEKIDYARTNWGATLFYLDSNGGPWRPDEVWQLRSVAKARPDVLLIPEHSFLPYAAFSAPYVALRKGVPGWFARLARRLFPGSFEVIDMGDVPNATDQIIAAWYREDILLFRAWFWSSDCELLEGLASKAK